MPWYQSIPPLLKTLGRNMVWHVPTDEKIIYLTFDDGPHPEITPWVMDLLDTYGAKATFFCVGDNVVKHNSTFEAIEQRGHRCGNHTMTHMKGWNNSNKKYFEDIAACHAVMGSDLFRPPYGRIKPSQVSALKKNYRIIMWSLLSCDFDKNLNREEALAGLKKHSSSGSIVVFHDSVKAEQNLKYLLPLYLQFLKEQGFICKTL